MLMLWPHAIDARKTDRITSHAGCVLPLGMQVELLRGREDGTCDHDVMRVSFPHQRGVAGVVRRLAVLTAGSTNAEWEDDAGGYARASSGSLEAESWRPQYTMGPLTFFQWVLIKVCMVACCVASLPRAPTPAQVSACRVVTQRRAHGHAHTLRSLSLVSCHDVP